MSIYRTVLVAVDLSEHSAKVVGRAVELFAGSEAELTLLHVVQPVLGDYSFELQLDDYDDFQHAHSAAVKAQLHALNQGSGLKAPEARVLLTSGHPVREIHRQCKERQADLLVIGSHGYGALLSVLGSTSASVMHGIGCDVLTVRI